MFKVNIFQRLSLRQWGWLIIAYWRLWPVLLRIKFKQFFANTAWFRKKVAILPNMETETVFESQLAQQMHESIRLAARLHFFRAECLPKSIVLADMLSARGLAANVVIGVSKKNSNFSSHAWVEIDGQMVSEPESIKTDFTPLKY